MTALVEHHLAAIPFENIDVLLDQGIDIGIDAIERKLVERHRGGYCFEHNGLFAQVLEGLGFEVERLAARVLWGRNGNDPLRPRTHMALRVRSDERLWLVDVGFGGACPVAPLALDDDQPQTTFLETFQLVPSRDGWIAQILMGDVWKPLYDVSRQALLEVDYVPLNWFTSTHPASPFKQHLMAACVTREARYSLLDARLTVRRRDGSQETRSLDADALSAALQDPFGLNVEPGWRELIERLAR
ncbi:MAG TPA: arylamine N-acetyltransferase [Pararobbsia sp.]|nr:arylamine N-acetyltransferase [Pararobbsia sp.]